MLSGALLHTINNTMSYLDDWNAMSSEAAAKAILPCCGSHAWATGVVARRPLGTLPELLAASDSAWWSASEADWNEAFESHPRIGEQHAKATRTSLQWSAGEQSSAMSGDDLAKFRLAEINRAYEERFGRIFLVCATGKSANDILAIAERRIRNTVEEELHEAAEQQREITHIRLRKWLTAKEQEHAE